MSPVNVKIPPKQQEVVPVPKEFLELEGEITRNQRAIQEAEARIKTAKDALFAKIKEDEVKLRNARISEAELDRQYRMLRWETLSGGLTIGLVNALAPKHREDYGCSDTDRRKVVDNSEGCARELNCNRCVLLATMAGEWFDYSLMDFAFTLKDIPTLRGL